MYVLSPQQKLCEGCNKVFANDRVQLLQSQVAARKRGRRVAPQKVCLICNELIRSLTSSGGRSKDGTSSVTYMCAFECGHCYHLPCLEEKMRMWKRSDIIARTGDGGLDRNALRETLGCFVCDHSARAHASSTPHHDTFVKNEPPPRGITEDQLQRAKDVLTLKMAAA
jgi:vacuolar protein sorting-associated protein 41